MSERDFEIKGTSFQVNKIDVFKQYHVVRRLAPILADLLPVMGKFASMSPDELKQDQFESLAPVLNGFAKLSDADSDYVLLALLSAVAMKQDSTGNYAQLVVRDIMMFKDVLDLPTTLQCAGRALLYNLKGFFSALPQVSKGSQ
jgi:hypothetical protein